MPHCSTSSSGSCWRHRPLSYILRRYTERTFLLSTALESSRAAQIMSFEYARKPGKSNHQKTAEIDLLISNLGRLLAALSCATSSPSLPTRATSSPQDVDDPCDFTGYGGWRVVFPKPQHTPSQSPEMHGRITISSTILSEFSSPPLGVTTRLSPMFWTAMPETTVKKYGDLQSRKAYINCPSRSFRHPYM